MVAVAAMVATAAMVAAAAMVTALKPTLPHRCVSRVAVATLRALVI
jgi:hypothetical protein